MTSTTNIANKERVNNRVYIAKTRWGTYELLTESQYEYQLIYG